MARFFLGNDAERSKGLATLGWDREALSPACRSEFIRLFDLVPRFTFGYEEMSGHKLVSRALLELAPAAAEAIQQLPFPVPGMDWAVSPPPLLSMGISLHLRETLRLVGSIAARIQREPYRCEHLTFLNHLHDGLQELVGPTTEEMELLHGLRGIFARLDGLSKDTRGEQRLRGLIVVAHEAPMRLAAALEKVLGVSLSLKHDGTPVPLDLPFIREIAPAFGEFRIAATPQALAVSFGPDMEGPLRAVLSSPPTPDPPLLVIVYDPPALVQLALEWPAMREILGTQNADGPSLLDVWRGNGVTRLRVGVASEGLVLHTSVEFPSQ